MMTCTPQRYELPPHLRPASIIVIVLPRIGVGLPLRGGYAVVAPSVGVHQAPCQDYPSASSHAQAVLGTLSTAISEIRGTTAAPIRIYLPDRLCVGMMSRAIPRRDSRAGEHATALRAEITKKWPNATFRYGNFYDLVDDIWLGDIWDCDDREEG
jgi:hypothetical protein